MPAAPTAASLEATFEPLTADRLETLMVVEEASHSYPWTRGNFLDALAAGYQIQMLTAGAQILGYFVALRGVGEVHLLNLTVAPQFRRQGWARLLLDALALWSRGQGAQWLWLEVRVSNTRARRIYEANGWRCVGQRKAYYPAPDGQREDALVLNLPL